jgi:hypothetical protein
VGAAIECLVVFRGEEKGCYKQVLEIDLGRIDPVRARRSHLLPVVLTPVEVAAVKSGRAIAPSWTR